MDSGFPSTGDDENALRVDGAAVTLKDITIEKTAGSSSNTEDGDFYGQNAGLLVLNGATATITGATVNTSVTNGNGVQLWRGHGCKYFGFHDPHDRK